MAGTGETIEVEEVAVADRGDSKNKKHKKHKSKKEKKEKKHRERKKSPSVEDFADQEVAVSVPGVFIEERALELPSKAEKSIAGNNLLPESSSRDIIEGCGTPESGEIGEKEPAAVTLSADGWSNTAVTSPSRKRAAEREEIEGSSKRSRSDANDAVKEIGTRPSEIATTGSPPHNGIVQPGREEASHQSKTDITRLGGAREALSRQSRAQHQDEARHVAEKDKTRERHRSASRHRDRDHDRDRSLKRSVSIHRRDEDRERRNGHAGRQHSRDGRRDDIRLRHRDQDRSRRGDYRRDEDRGRRDRDSDRRIVDSRHESDRKRKSREKEDKEFAAKVIAKLEENAVDEDELIEQRRRKRQELMAKLQQEKEMSEAVSNPTAAEIKGSEAVLREHSEAQAANHEISEANEITYSSPSTEKGDAENEPQKSPKQPNDDGTRETAEVASEDSDPEDEHALDEGDEAQLFQQRKDTAADLAEADLDNGSPLNFSEERHKIANQAKLTGGDELDMFTVEKVEDMFGDAPVGAPVPLQHAPKRGLLDNYDDSEGYYNFQVGEIMNDRYEVFATHGKGVFSTVLRARDRKPVDEKGIPIPVMGTAFPEVAIKVIRANDLMSKAGQTEVVILRKLAGADPTGKYHIIRLLHTFEYRHHLCLVFEPLESNLRQLTKKYGQGIGLRLDAVRSMAAQMLMALHLMKQGGVLHADIKPDNILINKGHNIVKICDFGSAMFTGTNEITPYLVSRFYRAPEIILGLHYDHPLDVWSIGCVIYELFTGRILFPGRSSNEMLKLMMDLKGPFPKKMLKKGEFAMQHFEDDPAMSFCLMEIDPLTKRPTKRLIPNPTIKKDFRGRLVGQEGDAKQVSNLIDLLEKMTHLDPDKRITAKDALRHPFIKDGRLHARS